MGDAGDPRFKTTITKRKLAKFNRAFARLLRERRKAFGFRQRWCCELREDTYPYFAVKRITDEQGHCFDEVRLVHDTVEKTRMCNLGDCSSLAEVDAYLHLDGSLLQIADQMFGSEC